MSLDVLCDQYFTAKTKRILRWMQAARCDEVGLDTLLTATVAVCTPWPSD